ncbi:MAG: MOSC domain-containing protein [Paracoccus sp. (in: a-proteobacteria)]|uniref:MOSC domain-containing protein n=1 Tax=Paracoccus sp. TaxID=267 RepID=UPI0026E0A10F|nr:MOSC N-terminal beta barrel domain-containing protein [Paracoccus sp. (in: a-proteobacteria)]MDO5613671.1 MOSC domain-containing protein [Paracoccus sp. (in: a-proteobacteria)]
MTATLAEIHRFPVKSVGGERLDRVTLTAGQILPGDRAFAVLHADGLRHLEADGTLAKWLPKSAFLRGAAAAGLQAIRGGWQGDRLRLTHPDRPPLDMARDDEAALLAWLDPLWPDGRARPARLVSAPMPLTDIRTPWVSILSRASLAALEGALGPGIGTDRWRGNLWVDGWDAWAERDMTGQCLRIGQAELIVRERITRCAATNADTTTGLADCDMPRELTALQGDADFGIYAEVLTGADIACGDSIEVLT